MSSNDDQHPLNKARHPLNVSAFGRFIIKPDAFADGWFWKNNTGVPLRVALVTPGEVHLEPVGSGDLAAPGESVTLAEEDVND